MLLFTVVRCVVFRLAYAGVGLGFGLLCGLAVCWVCGDLRGLLRLWWFVALLLFCLSGRILSDFGVAWFSGGFVGCFVLGFTLWV